MPDLVLDIERKSVIEPSGEERVLLERCVLAVSDRTPSLALLGRSGAGKSSLLRILAGLDVDYTGTYTYDGRVLRRNLDEMARMRQRDIGYVTQDHLLLAELTVADNVLLGRRRDRTARADADMLLERVGLRGFGNRLAGRLSGGEAQRVCLARALAKEPRLLLADEPTGALDEETETSILELFRELERDGITLIVATHSPTVAASCSQRLTIEHKSLVDADTAGRHPSCPEPFHMVIGP